MDTFNRRERRDVLAGTFADRLSEYQQAHRDLMEELRNPEMSVERFASRSRELHEQAVALKQMRAELDRQRNHLRENGTS